MKTPEFNTKEVFPKIKWRRPDIENIRKEAGEIERVVRQKFHKELVSKPYDLHFSMDSLNDSINPDTFKGIAQSFVDGEYIELTDEMWARLENTDSYHIDKGDLEKVIKLSKSYNKNYLEILTGIREGSELPSPMILDFGQGFHLVAGNTRLMIARALGERPQVLIGKYNK